MSKNIFRQFWSLDIVKTENWIKEMASKGYILKDINFITSSFKFEKGEAVENSIYRISPHKKGVKLLTKSLIENGWESYFQSYKWTILSNIKKEEDIKLYPSRDKILKRNKAIKYPLGILLAYLLIGPGLMMTFMTLSGIFSVEPMTITYMPGAIASRVIIVTVIASIFFVVLKLNKCDKKMREESKQYLKSINSSEVNNRLDYKTESMLISDKKIIKKRKIAWMYAPDKLEDYLEEMELKGYNLYKVSKLGVAFYFTKGEGKKVAYFVDKKLSMDDSYYEINKQSGWENRFKSMFMFDKYIIWSKEYTEEKPELYSDKEYSLKQARYHVLMQSILLVVMSGMCISILKSNVELYKIGIKPNVFLLIIFTVIIIEYSWFTYLSVGYYIRTNKKFK